LKNKNVTNNYQLKNEYLVNIFYFNNIKLDRRLKLLDKRNIIFE